MPVRGLTSKNLLHSAVALALGAAVYLVPIPGMPDPAKRCLAIVAVATWLWVTEAIPLFATSFLIVLLSALFLTGPLDIGVQVFFAPFFDPVIMLFLGGFILSQALDKYSLDDLLARAILNRTGAKPGNVLFGMMLVAAVLSMWMSNTAATALLVGLALTIIRRLEAGDPFRIALILGIPFAANIGGVATPIGTPPNAIALGILAEHGIRLSFVRWMAVGIPITAAMFFLLWWLLSKLFPARTATVTLPPVEPEPLDRRQWTVVITFAVTVLLWLTAELHKLPSSVVALVPTLVFTGLRLLDKEDFGRVGWDVLILMGGGLSLGVAIQRSGLTGWLMTLVHLEGVNPVLLTAAFTAVAMVVTTFISNTSAAALLLPLVAGLAPHPTVPVLAVAIGVSVSMVLPVSTPPNAIAYGSGLFGVRTMARVGIIVSAAGLVLVVLGVLALTHLFGLGR
ncbi:MAG TPA: SLC13/DASS family transporter [candidate division WOR-3 bacterium]|uniref:SLC13/DASS family transporter n=1 Tax=candidate division WOR-3 bacterium TaxID=2052148 RepID=A0A7V0T6D2_UNCW3|nr:SLC13/DASS family transporter [candidate division WOR-3 bacterium]